MRNVVWENHEIFKFKSLSTGLCEVNGTSKATKMAFFKCIDGEYYRATPWIRCTEFWNDWLYWMAHPTQGGGIYGFDRSDYDDMLFAYPPGSPVSDMAIGWGAFKQEPMDDFDPRVVENICTMFFDKDYTMHPHEKGFELSSMGKPSGKLYWNLAHLAPTVWDCPAELSLFSKSLRYHEWGLLPKHVEEFAENPSEKLFQEMFTKATPLSECQDGSMIRLFRDYPVSELRARLSKYFDKAKDNPRQFKVGAGADSGTVHVHGILHATYKAAY